MMGFRPVLASWCLLLSQLVLAEQSEYGVQNQQYNQNQQNQIEVCSDGVIQVRDIQVTCDSPGTFYYGSGKYRNSPTCVPGDKAQVAIQFYIAQPEVIANNGNYVLIDISASGGWGIASKTVYESADLCSLTTLSSKKSQCPYAGYYYINTHFYWDESSGSNGATSFYPKVTVGFKSSLSTSGYDYGGANTNMCRGSTFITWSNGVATTYANALGNFFKSFGILLVTMLCLAAFIWILAKRPTSFKDARQKLLIRKKNHLIDEEFDFSKMRKGGPNHDLVDF
jgi:hypothetical protein